MKFKIRYADQVVGFLAVAALLALFFVIFMIGSKQRWFARDYDFVSSFESASGINAGMPLQYKGFTIGKIRKFTLNDNNMVDVNFFIQDTYYNRVLEGSLIELIVNPIGLGNQLLFHPGTGTALIEEGSFIPRVDSAEGQLLIAKGLAVIPKRDDTISNLMAQVNPLLTNINDTLSQLNGAFRGTGSGPLAETMGNVAGITAGMENSLGEILINVRNMTAEMEKTLANPNGLVPTLLDPSGAMFESIEGSLFAVEGTLKNVEASSSIIKSQVPQIARLIEDLRIALVQGQDVLEALKNNPLLRNGVPERVQTDSSGTSSRNIDF